MQQMRTGSHLAGLNPSSQLCDLEQIHTFQASGAFSVNGVVTGPASLVVFRIKLVNFIAGWSQQCQALVNLSTLVNVLNEVKHSWNFRTN